ncbi:MAG: type II secretion system protein GspK [Bdellovibrionota bacterium]
MQPFLKKTKSFLNQPISNRRGIAMITAIVALSLMTYLAMEVMYDTQVEFIVHSQQINRIKAYYAARSGVDISLLRIKLYQTIVGTLGKNLPTDGMIDQVWQFPFMWPLELPKGTNAVDTDQINDTVKKSSMDSTFITTITDEGSRIDINDLNSQSKTLKNITKKQILNLFSNKMLSDEAFARRYSGFRFEELINNITDWMSNKSASLNGGDKKTYYKELTGSDDFPPNRSFRTLQELRLVKGMTDEFFDILEKNVTIYGLKGINPNTASKEVLQAIDPGITEEIVNEIKKRVSNPAEGGPFKNAEEFWQFLQARGARITVTQADVPIVTSGLFSFGISSIGNFGSSTREINVIVMDLNQAATRLNDLVKADAKKDNPQAEADAAADKTAGTPVAGPGSPSATNPLPKGIPRIVYWTEK